MNYSSSTKAISAPDAPVEAAPQAAAVTPHGLRGRDQKMTVGYVGVWLFLFFYFIRPADWYAPLTHIPFAKIIGIIPCLTLLVAFLTGTARFRRESKLLILLFIDLCICIPFSGWPGGSFALLMYQFSKVVLITLVLMMVTNTFTRLRKLLMLHVTALALL